MKIMKILSLGTLLGLAVSCGSSTESFIDHVGYAVDEKHLSLTVDFNNSLELNTEFTVPVKQYGSVLLSPADADRGMRLGFDLNLAVLIDDEYLSIERTRLLPNGMRMSRYVTEEMIRVRIRETDKIATSLYFSVNPDNFFLGSAIELKFMDQNFPVGLVITQWIKDQKSRPVGILTLYGPKVDASNTLLEPGGFLFMTNVTALMKYAQQDKAQPPATPGTPAGTISGQFTREQLSGEEITIDDAHKKEYSDSKKRRKLMKLFKEKGKEAGVIK